MLPLTLVLLAACGATPAAPGPCDVVTAQVGALPSDLVGWAQDEVDAARLDGDAGHHLLADQAIACLAERGPLDGEARRLRAHLHIQAHRFADAERVSRALVVDFGSWQDRMFLSDALMEQGRFSEAADALDGALALHTNLVLLDRAAWLAWSAGDLDQAVRLQWKAVRMRISSDSEPTAWSTSQLGWYLALQGDPSAAAMLEHALSIVPDYAPALLYRGRLRMYAGDPGAADDLRKAGDTIAARTLLAELEPATDVAAVAHTDPRGHAAWLLDRDPEAALALIEAELADRRDPLTLAIAAHATHRTGADGTALAEEALQSGTREPYVLWLCAQVLGDAELLATAKSFGPGLTPSQHALELP